MTPPEGAGISIGSANPIWGHFLALKTGTNYEALMVERICRPLKMKSTRITLTPELRARLARVHDQLGKPAPN